MVVLFTFTACGGGSGSSDSEEQKNAIKKISEYASDWQSHAQPTVDDYASAGVENIDAVDINELNTLVREASSEEVDTPEELNALVRTLIDTTAPVITLNGDSNIDITKGRAYSDAGATALDDRDGDISSKITTEGSVDTSKEGTYSIIYRVEDASGNRAEERRVINVVIEADTTAPVIRLNGDSNIDIIKGRAYSDAGATALDNRDGDISSKITTEGSVDTSKEGTYSIIYRVKDEAGNQSKKTRTVHVVLSSVGQLLEEAAKGTNSNVHYVVVGDSTRNLPDVNTVMVDSYYPEQLLSIGVEAPSDVLKGTAYSGTEAAKWLANNNNYYGKSRPTITDALKAIAGDGNNYILEFSLGINDTKSLDRAKIKKAIHDSIVTLHEKRKNLKIVMVSPVKFNLKKLDSSFNPTVFSSDLEAIYKEVYQELSANKGVDFYLTLVSGRKATEELFDNYHDTYYADWVHPNEDGSKVLFNYIFEHLLSSSTYQKIKL
jgi:hypothetical protein